MDEDNTKPAADATAGTLFDDWFDPIEVAVRTKVRGFIEAMIEEELSTVLCRPRYGRHVGSPSEDGKASPVAGHRHGHRKRLLTGTSDRPRSPFRAPDWLAKTARRRSGRARRCAPISAAPRPRRR